MPSHSEADAAIKACSEQGGLRCRRRGFKLENISQSKGKGAASEASDRINRRVCRFSGRQVRLLQLNVATASTTNVAGSDDHHYGHCGGGTVYFSLFVLEKERVSTKKEGNWRVGKLCRSRPQAYDGKPFSFLLGCNKG